MSKKTIILPEGPASFCQNTFDQNTYGNDHLVDIINVYIEKIFKGLTGNGDEETNQTKNLESSNNRQIRLFYKKVLHLSVRKHFSSI
jgi:hypothetical protein